MMQFLLTLVLLVFVIGGSMDVNAVQIRSINKTSTLSTCVLHISQCEKIKTASFSLENAHEFCEPSSLKDFTECMKRQTPMFTLRFCGSIAKKHEKKAKLASTVLDTFNIRRYMCGYHKHLIDQDPKCFLKKFDQCVKLNNIVKCFETCFNDGLRIKRMQMEAFNEPSRRTINATFDMDEKNLLPNETSIANDSSQMVDLVKLAVLHLPLPFDMISQSISLQSEDKSTTKLLKKEEVKDSLSEKIEFDEGAQMAPNKLELKVTTKEPKEKNFEHGFPPEQDAIDDDDDDENNCEEPQDVIKPLPHPPPSKLDMIAQEPVVKSESAEISLVCWKFVICCYGICTLLLFSF